MKKIDENATLLPDYGKKKLLTYADSFRDLAKIFTYLPKGKLEAEDEDRQTFFMHRRLCENRELLADHLNEMAQIMTRVAEESFCFMQLSDKQEKQIRNALKNQGIYLEHILMIRDKQQRLEITANIKAVKPVSFTIEEIAGLLSVIFNRRFVPVAESVSFLSDEQQTVVFEEETTYGLLTGVARAIKENEKISGDNYSFAKMRRGYFLTALSDGMGAGEKACKDSETVIELLEKLLEAGFGEETAIQIINGVLIAGSEQQNMSTLDVCRMDLYRGELELIKIGSAPTYIKKEDQVEEFVAETLPLGVFQYLDMGICRKKLEDGDYIILLSDGVTDAVSFEGNSAIFMEYLENMKIQGPKEMANHILNYAIHLSKGRIRDDMTVLVVGVWENGR